MLKTLVRGTLALALCAVAVVAPTPPAAAQESLSETEAEAVREIVRELLRSHPELVVEALQSFEEKQRLAAEQRRRQAVAENAELLDGTAGDPVLGATEGDVVVVEFFDYNCGYCRQVSTPLRQAIQSDGNIKLVMKEWPILGPPSYFAARASLAAEKQGLYEEFHFALMQTKERVNEDLVLQVAERVGLDMERLRADMLAPEIDAKLQETYDLAEALGITGTPAFVIGDELLPGAITMSRLQQVVERQRAGQ
jgi:protein-disulfide isomerase